MKNKINLKIQIFFAFFLFCFAALFIQGCSKNKNISLDDDGKLYLAPDVSWALVQDPYATFRKDPSWSSEANGHCRKNEVLMILGKASDDEENVWYRFDSGWLSSNAVVVYSNRYKAMAAAKSQN